MAGYSGTPLPQKLGLKPGVRFVVLNEPAEFQIALGKLPEDVERTVRMKSATVIVLFVRRQAELVKGATRAVAALAPDAALWIAWPKKSSGVATVITENGLRELLLPLGVVDNKVCAIDATWSGLRFVWRVELRAERRTGKPTS